MSIHIKTTTDKIDEKILLPGDPLRAKFIAENFLTESQCYNEIRGLLGYTGIYRGEKVSVQASGMGVPSLHIVVSELIMHYHVKRLIRVGTCGAFREDMELGDIVLAMSASTDSAVNTNRFVGFNYSPTANYKLLSTAASLAERKGIEAKIGNILTSDIFYHHDKNEPYEMLKKHGVLGVEMESAELYTLAARFDLEALTILSVSDNLSNGKMSSPKERQESFGRMIELALETILA
jgi:purine-nucleoside phosphorylase